MRVEDACIPSASPSGQQLLQYAYKGRNSKRERCIENISSSSNFKETIQR